LKPPGEVTLQLQEKEMALLRNYNHQYLETHFTNPDLQGRMDAYDLAYRMQAEVWGVLDIERESAATREMYGLKRSHDGIVRQAVLNGQAPSGAWGAIRAALHAQPVVGRAY